MEQTIKVENRNFYVQTENTGANIQIKKTQELDGIYEYSFKVSFPQKTKVLPIKVKWNEKMLGTLSVWGADVGRNRRVGQYYAATVNQSSFYKGMPLLGFVNQGSENYSLVALSDAENKIKISAAVNDFEEKENLDFIATFFVEEQELTDYECKIRIDNRAIPFYTAIKEVGVWWEKFYPETRKRTVFGEYPVYSTWYNYHQHPESFTMEKELEIAADLGFKAVIIDDGWSYDGLGNGDYANCGNWKVVPSKFPNFKDFVKKAHDLGLKVMVWFPVPFVGYDSIDFEPYKDVMLYLADGFRAGVLDMRYPKARRYILESYKKMVYDYNLDGLKLDFIDTFYPLFNESLYNGCGGASGKDCESITDGVKKLLMEIQEEFKSVSEDFMIEFRQYYVGPSITKYCNMLRVGDCPFDVITNREGIVDLRLTNYNLAVHADMLYWANNEEIEKCGKQLLNIMFGVPQISVLLTKASKEQLQVIKTYLEYWWNNREVIMHGEFKPLDPENNYTFVSSKLNDKEVAVSFALNAYEYKSGSVDLFNATERTNYYIENASNKTMDITVSDCLGNTISQQRFTEKVVKIFVPVAGKIEIR